MHNSGGIVLQTPARDVLISGNTIINTDDDHVKLDNVDNVVIIGNVCRDDQATPTADRCIHITSASGTNMIVTDNMSDGNETVESYKISVTGANVKFDGNVP